MRGFQFEVCIYIYTSSWSVCVHMYICIFPVRVCIHVCVCYVQLKGVCTCVYLQLKHVTVCISWWSVCVCACVHIFTHSVVPSVQPLKCIVDFKGKLVLGHTHKGMDGNATFSLQGVSRWYVHTQFNRRPGIKDALESEWVTESIRRERREQGVGRVSDWKTRPSRHFFFYYKRAYT